MPQSSGRGVAGNARIQAPEKGDLEEAVQMEARRELRLLNWRLSAHNLFPNAARPLDLRARVSCMIKALLQVPEVRDTRALSCTDGRGALPYFSRVMGAAEEPAAIQLAQETEPAS